LPLHERAGLADGEVVAAVAVEVRRHQHEPEEVVASLVPRRRGP
jgi:hypothetical protein